MVVSLLLSFTQTVKYKKTNEQAPDLFKHIEKNYG